MHGEQLLAAHRHHRDRGDPVAAQPGVAAQAVTDRDIHPIGNEIRQSARGGDVELDIRVPRAKTAEQMYQP